MRVWSRLRELWGGTGLEACLPSQISCTNNNSNNSNNSFLKLVLKLKGREDLQNKLWKGLYPSPLASHLKEVGNVWRRKIPSGVWKGLGEIGVVFSEGREAGE